MEIPFVSEDFQRAFRNQFPAQVSTGRDLHVSDTVIPVVDFSPNASGASLPTNLQFCRNINSQRAGISSSSTGDISTSTGFLGIDIQFITDGNNNYLEVYIEEISSGTKTTIEALIGNVDVYNQFVMYVPSGYKVTYQTGGAGTHSGVAIITPLADINGNLVQPSGYDPQ